MPFMPPRAVSRRIVRAALVLAATVGVCLASATASSAHDAVSSTSPADRSTVAVVPPAVMLRFDEPALALGTVVVVTGPAGPVQAGPARVAGTTVTEALQAGAPAGEYTVRWRVTSADGHPVSGTFIFVAKAAAPGAHRSAVASPSAPSTLSAPKSSASRGQGQRPGLGLVAAAVAAVVAALALAALWWNRRRAPR